MFPYVSHWAHLSDGSLAAPVLTSGLISANCPNAIIDHRSDSWHMDSCLLEMRGAPRKLLSHEELVHMRN